MTLIKELKIQTLVLLVKRPSVFNPADFNQYWLDVNGIMDAKTISKTSIFAPQFVQASSEKMSLIVTPDQIQVAGNAPETFREINLINSISLVKAMEDITLNGIGVNFNWYIMDDILSYNELSARYFFNPSCPVSKFFNEQSSMFGYYLSKNINPNVRLKLDIKPVHLNDVKAGKLIETIQLTFNFHSDLNCENQKDMVLDIISKYDDFYKITEEMIDSFI